MAPIATTEAGKIEIYQAKPEMTVLIEQLLEGAWIDGTKVGLMPIFDYHLSVTKSLKPAANE